MSSATIRDVAKHAGVGVGTVSRVLNGRPSVKESTRRRVLSAIDDLDYAPNPIARRLSLGKTSTIGVVVPFFTNPSVVERLRGVVSALADSEYDLVLFDVETPERRDACLHDVPRRERLDGLLIISLNPSDSDAKRFAQTSMPVVLVDAYHQRLNRVIVDNVGGGCQATQHLIDRGHRSIAFISDYLEDPFNSPVRDRFTGYRQALAAVDIPFRPEYHRQGVHGRVQARAMTHQLLSLPDPPTAIFAYSDTQAIGVVEAAEERGMTVPGDLSVIGYDNIEAAEYLHLTTVDQSLYESGVAGGKLLLEAVDTVPTAPQEVVLPTEVIVRDTTGPPA